jgi:Macrocin-O-methyltransferase (TylF)
MPVCDGAATLIPGVISRQFWSIAPRVAMKLMRIAARDIDLAQSRITAEESAAWLTGNAPMAKSCKSKFELLDLSLGKVGIPGLYCEFGVFEGTTINYIAKRSPGKVHGFDSFEGLPEDWRQGHETAKFKLSGLPEVASNVALYKGWFDQSLPEFLESHPEQVSFLHIDCDLYSSTKTVLTLLASRIRPGTVIQFDEYFNYPGWTAGEHKAFQEFCAETGAEIEYLGYVSTDEQVAIRITDLKI